MRKKIILSLVIITAFLLIALFVILLGRYYWQLNWPPSLGQDDLSGQPVPMLDRYYNIKYRYSVKFPEKWFIGYFGDTKKEANNVWFVSNIKDLEIADGGVSLDARIEIIFTEPISDSDNLEKMVAEIRDEGPGELYGETRKLSEEKMIVAREKAIKTTWVPASSIDKEGPPIEIYFFALLADHRYLVKINYLGREPAYSNNLGIFNQTINSFSFNNSEL